ncbi:hypothetical protein BH20CHL7_BH20CHL7_07570 [soil metagenome]
MSTSASPPSTSVRRRHRAGQSLVEFAVLLPVLLAFVGVTTDVARLYQVWVDLESASRSAAESLATNVDKTATNTNAGTKAKVFLDAEARTSFTVVPPNGSLGACATPTVKATYSASTSAVGASASYPIGTSTVSACIPFRPLFSYPFVTINGNWILNAEQTYQIVQGR